jgi:hypothetical protein
MTAEQKAIYLTDRYLDQMPKLKNETPFLIMSYAKLCASILVDEMINETGSTYWYNVMREIHKL